MGSYNAAGLPEMRGSVTAILSGENSIFKDAFTRAGEISPSNTPSGPNTGEYIFQTIWMKASLMNDIYGKQPTVMPASVDMPVGLYLGHTA